MEEAGEDSIGAQKLLAEVIGIFGALVLVITIVGLYGLLSCLARQRTREIGIRMALGGRSAKCSGHGDAADSGADGNRDCVRSGAGLG
jgi:hypothetical protein